MKRSDQVGRIKIVPSVADPKRLRKVRVYDDIVCTCQATLQLAIASPEDAWERQTGIPPSYVERDRVRTEALAILEDIKAYAVTRGVDVYWDYKQYHRSEYLVDSNYKRTLADVVEDLIVDAEVLPRSEDLGEYSDILTT